MSGGYFCYSQLLKISPHHHPLINNWHQQVGPRPVASPPSRNSSLHSNGCTPPSPRPFRFSLLHLPSPSPRPFPISPSLKLCSAHLRPLPRHQCLSSTRSAPSLSPTRSFALLRLPPAAAALAPRASPRPSRYFHRSDLVATAGRYSSSPGEEEA